MRQLIVKNFGPIKSVSIDLRDYNFFIGGQGVGKSTLAKLISIFTDFRIYWDMSVSDENVVWKNKLTQYNISGYLKPDTYISFRLKSEIRKGVDYIDLSFEYQNSTIHWDGISQFANDEDPKNKKAVGLLLHLGKDRFSEYTNTILKLNAIENGYGHLSDELLEEFMSKVSNSYQNILYVPAERILFSMLPKMQSALSIVDQSIPKMFLYYSILFNDAKSFFKTYHIDIFNLDYEKKEEEDLVRLNDGKEIALNATSSGMQSLIPLLLTLDYSIKQRQLHSYVIEEPECNLYPDNQSLLIDKIIGLIGQSGIQNSTVTITTHSPYIVNYLNVLMRRAEKSVGRPAISADNLSAYLINEDGTAENLMAIDTQTGRQVVNTFDLTNKMSEMYAEYSDLA